MYNLHIMHTHNNYIKIMYTYISYNGSLRRERLPPPPPNTSNTYRRIFFYTKVVTNNIKMNSFWKCTLLPTPPTKKIAILELLLLFFWSKKSITYINALLLNFN